MLSKLLKLLKFLKLDRFGSVVSRRDNNVIISNFFKNCVKSLQVGCSFLSKEAIAIILVKILRPYDLPV